MNIGELENCLLPEQYKIVEELEQKYFPKEIIEEVVKGITKQIKEGAEITREEAKTDEDKMD